MPGGPDPLGGDWGLSLAALVATVSPFVSTTLALCFTLAGTAVHVLAAANSGSGNGGTGADTRLPYAAASTGRQQPQLPSSAAPAAAPSAAAAAAVDIAIEPGPSNSRCIWAGVDIAAPASAVYAALTAYEQLGTFIPGWCVPVCVCVCRG